jgi:hypothetical protein
MNYIGRDTSRFSRMEMSALICVLCFLVIMPFIFDVECAEAADLRQFVGLTPSSTNKDFLL